MKLRWALGLGIVAALAVATPALADNNSTVDIAAARRAATAPATTATLARFFASTASTHSHVATKQGVVGDSVAVYELNPAFVRSPSAPVTQFEYVATTAASGDGRYASIWTAQTPSGWAVVNIASGNDEAAYAARAARLGGTAFQEPQINGWYALRGDRVLPLNAEARTSLGTAAYVSVTAYQALVHQRYADKQPGSAYDMSGMAGGYGVGASGGGVPAQIAPWALAGVAALIAAGLVGVPRLRRR